MLLRAMELDLPKLLECRPEIDCSWIDQYKIKELDTPLLAVSYLMEMRWNAIHTQRHV
jgi:hypothetical protein